MGFSTSKDVNDEYLTPSTVTGAASTAITSNLTANRALVTNSSGKMAVSAVTTTELGYLDNATSNIQTQLNGKLSTADFKAANITITTAGTAYSDLFTVGDMTLKTRKPSSMTDSSACIAVTNDSDTAVYFDYASQDNVSTFTGSNTVGSGQSFFISVPNGAPNVKVTTFSIYDAVSTYFFSVTIRRDSDNDIRIRAEGRKY